MLADSRQYPEVQRSAIVSGGESNDSLNAISCDNSSSIDDFPEDLFTSM